MLFMINKNMLHVKKKMNDMKKLTRFQNQVYLKKMESTIFSKMNPYILLIPQIMTGIYSQDEFMDGIIPVILME